MSSSGQTNWRPTIDFVGWTMNVEKRLMHEERRPQNPVAGVLGMGFGQYSVQVYDWNDEGLLVNGFWWSNAGAQNTPEVTLADPTANYVWIGRSQAIDLDQTYGMQWIALERWSDPVDPATQTPSRAGWRRRWYDPQDGGQVQYSPWYVEDGVPVGMVMLWSDPTLPPGWLFCDGSVYSPIFYPTLYARIGTSFGGTSGSPLLPSVADPPVTGPLSYAIKAF